MDEKRLKNSEWDPSVCKMGKRMGRWLGRLLNIAGRATLVSTSLSSLPCSCFPFMVSPKGSKKV